MARTFKDQRKYQIKQMVRNLGNYRICRWDDSNQNWEILESFNTYEDADSKLDDWCERLPYSYIDILSSAAA